MPCRIALRRDQSSNLIDSSTRDGVMIYAPTWVQQGLDLLTEKLDGLTFEVHDKAVNNIGVMESFTISKAQPLTLTKLQMVARCEPWNVTGVIDRTHYESGGLLDPEVILAIRDLVRQTVIVGLDETTHYGGYPNGGLHQQVKPVYICDLAGLQFQQAYNTGRLVLVKDKTDRGLLDKLIFEKVVGEPKKGFEQVQEGTRYVRHDIPSVIGYEFFDALAYRKFVSADVVLSGLAVNESASRNQHSVNFKFLKYGTGYFAGIFHDELGQNILAGVIDGLEILFRDHSPTAIKSLEFPYYTEDDKNEVRLGRLKSRYGIDYRFSRDDALKVTTDFITATTNCADPHAACGNEMKWSSVDGAIAENLKSKGNIFCPCLNKRIQEKWLSF